MTKQNATLYLVLLNLYLKVKTLLFLISNLLIKLVDEEKSIALLVLGAATGTDGPGPLIELLVEKQAGRLRVPVTIVPGNLTDQQLDQIC